MPALMREAGVATIVVIDDVSLRCCLHLEPPFCSRKSATVTAWWQDGQCLLASLASSGFSVRGNSDCKGKPGKIL